MLSRRAAQVLIVLLLPLVLVQQLSAAHVHNNLEGVQDCQFHLQSGGTAATVSSGFLPGLGQQPLAIPANPISPAQAKPEDGYQSRAPPAFHSRYPQPQLLPIT